MANVQNPYPIVNRISVIPFVQSYWALNPLNEMFSNDPDSMAGLQFQIDSMFRYVVFKTYDAAGVLQTQTILINDQNVPQTAPIQTER